MAKSHSRGISTEKLPRVTEFLSKNSENIEKLEKTEREIRSEIGFTTWSGFAVNLRNAAVRRNCKKFSGLGLVGTGGTRIPRVCS